MNKKFCIIITLTIGINFITIAQKSNEQNINLEILGVIESTNKSNFELTYCIANSAMIMGITSYTETEKDALESANVKGNYSYNYYVNDYELQAGSISFNYSYNITDGNISYKFYNFEHDGAGTEFESIGIMPKMWNKEVGKIFTEKQFIEIMKDLFTNSANAIRMIKKTCLN